MPEDLAFDSPAIASWKGLFKFVARYPKVLLLVVFVRLIASFGNWIDLYLFFDLFMYRSGGYLPFPSSPQFASILPSTPFLPLVTPQPLVYRAQLDFEFTFSIIAYLVAIASFPLLVSQGFDNKKIELSRVFRKIVNQIPKVILYVLVIIGVGIFFGGIGGLLSAFLLSESDALGSIVGITYLFIIVYVMLRFYLVLPVLILERNSYGEQMGVKDAFKLGFEYTEGNVLSILGLSILVGITIFLPLNIVDFFIKSQVITNFWNPQWSNWFEISSKIIIWETVVGIFGVFTAILPSIYYYAIVRKKKI